MADDQHLAVLAQGAEAWNAWRKQAPAGLVPDLAGADLGARDLTRVNFRGANLRGAKLKGSVLAHADMRDSRLDSAHLEEADLRFADLSGATLDGAVIAHAYLEEARIHGGTARGADFRGIQAWHLSMGSWLPDYPEATDLTGANLNRAWLPTAQVQGTVMNDVQARDAVFDEAALAGVKARGADFSRARFKNGWLDDADFSGALLVRADLSSARVRKANISDGNLEDATLVDADLRSLVARGTRFTGAKLSGADLRDADCDRADFTNTDLSLASLVQATLAGATLTQARVYGVSAWSTNLQAAAQDDLLITPEDEPSITVDDLEVAQFVYLMLDNQKIRNVLDAVTSKTVLILGRFSAERKPVLDAIRDDLRMRDLVSIIFDFDPSAGRNLTETITLLARMARYVIVDLTDPSSVPHELHAIVSDVAVPVQPVIQGSNRPYAMFVDLLEEDSVLPVRTYEDAPALVAALSELLLALEETRRALVERRERAKAKLPVP